MTIKVGDRIPTATLFRMGEDGPEKVSTDDYFAARKIVAFGLPGAFTRTCSASHLPGFLAHADEFRAKGVDAIACISVNDAYVMGAWGNHQGVGDRIDMLGDGGVQLTRAMGLDVDRTETGMGIRSKRYAMVVDDGVVTALKVEEQPVLDVSSAEKMLDEV